MTTVRLRLAFLAAALALCAVARAEDSPAGRVVGKVVPVGLKAVPLEQVRNVMHTRAGKPYDPDVISQDVQRLNDTKQFVPNSIEISTAVEADGKVTVFVKLQELAGVAKEIIFKGAQHLSDSELMDLTGLRRDGPMNPAMNRLAATAILTKLRDDGRYYASVELLEGGVVTDTRIVFSIVEGPAVRVKRVKFRGNQAASTGRLATQVVTGSAMIPGFVTPLTPKFKFESIDEDRKRLVEYYQRLGYLDAAVREEIEPVNGGGAVNIIYHISEGRPYTVRNVTIEGKKSLPEERLRQVTEVKAGDTFNVGVVQADEKRLETLVGNAGHQSAVKYETFAVPNEPGKVDVRYVVQQQGGEPDRVGNIIIRGNTVTQQRVILNQLGFFPGQVLQYSQLEAATNNLRRLQLFDNDEPPTVRVAPSSDGSQYKDLFVTVKETKTGQITAQANVNSDAGLSGSLVLNQRNFDILRVPTSLDDLTSGKAFLGGGQELRVEATPGTLFQRYAVTLREPYFLDTRFGVTGSGYYFTRSYAEYNEQRLGARASVDYRFAESPIWSANFSTRIEDVNVTKVPAWATRAISDDAGHSTVLGLRGGLRRDTRDSYLLPSSGSTVDLGFEQVLGDYTFPIGTLEATKYFTLWSRKDGSGKHVFSNRTQLTVMGQNAPVFERVYAGGIRSFRGFSFRGVGPVENDLNVGGTFGFLNSHEYQVPVLANDKLWFAAFVDHGTVERSFEIKDYRVSVGVGVRISVAALGPLPLAFDFAFPVRQAPGDHKQVFNFSLSGGY